MTLGEYLLRLHAIVLIDKLDALNEMVSNSIGNPMMSKENLDKIQKSRQLETESLFRRYSELKEL